MNQVGFQSLRGLSNDAIEQGLRQLLGAGARVEARVVAHLAVVEARRIHLLAGRSSMYEYCQKDLGLSDYEAFCRIAAVRVTAKYPVVLGMLEQREVHLTAVVEVREFLTEANHRELLAEISGKTKVQIREALARRFPEADLAARIRRLSGAENRAQRVIAPLAADRYRLQLTISADLKRQLEQAQELLSHANPHGDLAVVLERALPLLIAKLRSRRFGLKASRAASTSGAPHSSPPPDGATQPSGRADAAMAKCTRDSVTARNRRRAIPAQERRKVAERDGEQCTFVDERGRRCECRAFLEMDHREAWARGGGDAADNLRLMCRQHNRLLAERTFGAEHVAAAIDQRQREGRERRRKRAA